MQVPARRIAIFSRRLGHRLQSSSLGILPLIQSAKNEKYKLFKAVGDSARARKKTGLRVFEGLRLVEDAIQNGFCPAELFVSSGVAESMHGRRLLGLLEEKSASTGSPVTPYCVDDGLMSSLAETVHSQEVVALFHAPSSSECIDKYVNNRRKNPTRVDTMLLLCDGVSDPGNLGTLVRSSLGFGAGAVVSVGGCDPWASKTVRSSMGACLRIPIVQVMVAHDVVSQILKQEQLLLVENNATLTVYFAAAQNTKHTSGQSSMSYDEADYTGPFALVVGSEARGVSAEMHEALSNNISGSTFKIVQLHIPFAVQEMDSFNAAVAGSVILAEAARQRRMQNRLPSVH